MVVLTVFLFIKNTHDCSKIFGYWHIDYDNISNIASGSFYREIITYHIQEALGISPLRDKNILFFPCRLHMPTLVPTKLTICKEDTV